MCGSAVLAREDFPSLDEMAAGPSWAILRDFSVPETTISPQDDHGYLLG